MRRFEHRLKSQSIERVSSMPRLTAIAIVSLALCAGIVVASGSSRGGVSPGPTGASTIDPFLITHVVKATIIGLDPEGKTFTIRDLKTEKTREVKFHADLVLRSKNKKDFGGRRRLDPADLATGQIVKMTVRDADGAVLKIRVEGIIET